MTCMKCGKEAIQSREFGWVHAADGSPTCQPEIKPTLQPTDTERLDKLERLLWSDRITTGLALWPLKHSTSGKKLVAAQDIGEGDGEDFLEDLTPKAMPSLRALIDAIKTP